MNPKYERNLQLDAKLVAAAAAGGEHLFLKVAASMKLWATPQDAIDYAKNIRQQDHAYRIRVGNLAARMVASVRGAQ